MVARVEDSRAPNREAEDAVSSMDRWILKLIMVGIAVGIPLMCGYIGLVKPWIAVAFAVLLVGGALMLRFPLVSVGLATFLLYTNAAVVAATHNGFPKVIWLVIPALFAIKAIENTVAKKRGLIGTSALPWMGVFLASALLGLTVSQMPARSWASIQSFVLEGMLTFVLAVNAIRNETTLRIATWGLMLSTVLLAGVPMYQQVTRSFDNQYHGFGQTDSLFRTHAETTAGHRRQMRLTGPIGEQNRYAQVCLVLVPVGIFLAVAERRKWLKAIALGTGIAALIGFALAFLRGAAIAAVLTVMLGVYWGIIRWRHLGYVVVGGFCLLLAFPQYTHRLASIASVTSFFSESAHQGGGEPDGATTRRVTEMLAAGLVWLDYPVVGVGAGQHAHYCEEYGNKLSIHRIYGTRNSHCLYLGLAADYGTLGFIGFMGMVIAPGLRLLRAGRTLAKKRPTLVAYCHGYALSLTLYMTTGIFLHMGYQRFFYLQLSLGAACAAIALNAERELDVSAERTGTLPAV